MKKTIFYIIMVFVALDPFKLHAQQYFGWYRQISVTGGYFTAIHFPAPNTGFVAGDPAVILRTTNGGDLWEVQQFNSAIYKFHKLYFPTENTGYLVGGAYPTGAVVMKTTNNGLNWSFLQSPTNVWLNAVYFSSDNTGYIAGNSGILMKTTNGGSNWNQLVSGTTNYLTHIYFTNLNTGYVSGETGILIKTTNAGLNWFDLQPGMSSNINSIFFRNDNTGYLAAYDGYIGKTTNAGVNWSLQRLSFITGVWDSFLTIFFADGNTGYVAGQHSVEYKTTDGGHSWFYQLPWEPDNIENLWFASGDTGYAVGGGPQVGGFILKTVSGGVIGIKKIGNVIPQEFSLFQNFPNPFNPVTLIKYQIPVESFVSLKVFNALGQEVETLVNENQVPGTYEAKFDGSNFASGIYFCTMKAGGFIETKKMLLIK